jgi:hypothetical protein
MRKADRNLSARIAQWYNDHRFLEALIPAYPRGMSLSYLCRIYQQEVLTDQPPPTARLLARFTPRSLQKKLGTIWRPFIT